MSLPLIAIDGPAGAGKTSTSQAVAARLGVPYLDTGALYRAVTYVVMQKGVKPGEGTAMKRLLERAEFRYCQGADGIHVWVDGEDVTAQLRTSKVTQAVSSVCEVHEVRRVLVDMQRQWAARGFGVVEGRDIGTVVLPHAGLKIFMTASPEVRALRRGRDLDIADNSEALAKLAGELTERDRRDIEREESPLKQAKDAITLDTSHMTFEEQVNHIVQLASEKFEMKLYGARIDQPGA